MRKTAGHSYFEKDIKYNQYPKLQHNIKTDVLIIGGGVTGALTAYILKESNIDSILVEKDNIGKGSTLASTSILHYEIDRDLQRLISLIGEENAVKAFEMCLHAVSRLKNIITNLDDDCDFISRPSFYYTIKNEQYEYLYDEYKLRKSKGFDVEFFDGKKDKDKFSFPYVAGIFSNNYGAEVNPVKLTNALLAYCSKKYMPIFENTEISSYEINNNKPIVITEDGCKIECNYIILCTGYDNLKFVEENLYTITRTFVLTTKPVDDFKGWHQRCLIKDTSEKYTYIRTTNDNRIIIGGEDIDISLNADSKLNMEDNDAQAENQYNKLKIKLDYLFPFIKNKEIEFEYNGVFVDSLDGLPYIGLDKKYPKIFFNTSIGSNGLLYGLIGAEVILKLYLNLLSDEENIYSIDRRF